MEIGKLYRFTGGHFPSFFEEHKYFFFCLDGSTKDLEDNILVLLLEHHDRMSKILAPDGSVGYVYTDCLKEVT